MKLSEFFKKATKDPINFQPDGNDTFRSQKVSSGQFQKFCDVLREAQVDPNARTRDRGVTFSDPNYNAVFRDVEGKIVCDVSVVERLRQQGLMDKAGITVAETKNSAAAPARQDKPQVSKPVR